jgi:hypothetical protein
MTIFSSRALYVSAAIACATSAFAQGPGGQQPPPATQMVL